MSEAHEPKEKIEEEVPLAHLHDQNYGVLKKGTIKRSIIWRLSVVSIFILTLVWVANTFGQPTREYGVKKKAGVLLRKGEWRADAYESVTTFHPGDTQAKFIAFIVACVILVTLIMILKTHDELALKEGQSPIRRIRPFLISPKLSSSSSERTTHTAPSPYWLTALQPMPRRHVCIH